jgi:hypothetical protein
LCKPDLGAYTEFKNQEQYATWIEDTGAVMRAQGLGNILNPAYIPLDSEREKFENQQAFTYMMLKKKVLTLTGRQIVKRYKREYDAQAVLLELAEEGMLSTFAVLSGRELLRKLTSMKFDPRGGKETAMAFITRFETMALQYNKQQEDEDSQLTDTFKKNLLTAGVSTVAILRAVSDREQEALMRGGRPFGFNEYLAILKTAATLYDESAMGRRSVNLTELEFNQEETTDEDIVEEINEFLVNVMRRRVPGASMNKETWESLSADGKATWDKLDEADKRKVLQYALGRAKKESIEANVTETTEANATDNETEEVTGAGTFTEAEINQAITQARKDAHPGDTRRVLGGKGKPRGKVQVKNINFTVPEDTIQDPEGLELERAMDRYWNPPSDSEGEDF